MEYFSIRDIENLCAIKAHTLRIWEQRYGLCVARRKDSQRRVYDNEDLKQLLRVSFLYHTGHKISNIARLSTEEIRQLVEAARVTNNNYEAFIQQLTEAGVDLDKEKFEKLVNTLVMRIGFEKALTGVFFPFLERIGQLWMTNHMLPAQEHFASHIIRKKLILATDGIDAAPGGPLSVAVFAPEGELHEIPLLTANYFFRKAQIRTAYFGVNMPIHGLEYYLDNHPCTHLYTHVITCLKGEGLEHYLQKLGDKYPGKQLLLSGPVIRQLPALPPHVKILHSLDELIGFAHDHATLISASHNS